MWSPSSANMERFWRINRFLNRRSRHWHFWRSWHWNPVTILLCWLWLWLMLHHRPVFLSINLSFCRNIMFLLCNRHSHWNGHGSWHLYWHWHSHRHSHWHSHRHSCGHSILLITTPMNVIMLKIMIVREIIWDW